MGQLFYDDDGYVRVPSDPVPEQLGLPLCRWCAGQVYENKQGGVWYHRMTGSGICDGQKELPYARLNKAEPLYWSDAE
jgi:hypothetical protein